MQTGRQTGRQAGRQTDRQSVFGPSHATTTPALTGTMPSYPWTPHFLPATWHPNARASCKLPPAEEMKPTYSQMSASNMHTRSEHTLPEHARSEHRLPEHTRSEHTPCQHHNVVRQSKTLLSNVSCPVLTLSSSCLCSQRHSGVGTHYTVLV